MPRIDQRTAMVGGAVLVVGLALFQRSRSGGDVGSSDPSSVSNLELDTTTTDLYNELQPELERINDALDGLKDGIPTTPPSSPKPPPPKPGPKPPNPTFTAYVVKKGDTLLSISRRFGIGRQRLYDNNRAVLEAAAKAHGQKSSNNGRKLYPGTVLRVAVKPKA